MEKWIIYRNNGSEFIGGPEIDYQITKDKTKALIFSSKIEATDYKKFYDEESVKSGNGRWMVIKI